MAEHTEQAVNAAQEPSVHVVLVPEHLREQVEEHVRHLGGEEDDTSAYFGMRLVTYQSAISCLEGGGYDYMTDHRTVIG